MTWTCAQCSQPLTKKQTGAKTKFCSRSCCRRWYEEHRPLCHCGCGRHLEAGRGANRYRKEHYSLKLPPRICKCGCGAKLGKLSGGHRYLKGHAPQQPKWNPSQELISMLKAIGYAQTAARLGMTKNTLIGRMHRRGYAGLGLGK